MCHNGRTLVQVDVEVLQTGGVEARRTADNTVDIVTLLEEEFRPGEEVASTCEIETTDAQVLTDIFTLDDAVRNSAAETLTSLLLVTVVTGTIQETVARLDGVVDGL